MEIGRAKQPARSARSLGAASGRKASARPRPVRGVRHPGGPGAAKRLRRAYRGLAARHRSRALSYCSCCAAIIKTAIEELGLPLLRQGENLASGRALHDRRRQRGSWRAPASRCSRMRSTASRPAPPNLDDSPGMIRPITLNVVGHVLVAGPRERAVARRRALLVRHYIEQSVEQPAIRDFAPRVLKELVTEQGTKRPRSEQDLVEADPPSAGRGTGGDERSLARPRSLARSMRRRACGSCRTISSPARSPAISDGGGSIGRGWPARLRPLPCSD